MERAVKDTQIGEIKARFDKMSAAVFLDYKGMTVEQVTKLRAEFRKSGVEYKVVKNTLVGHAIQENAWAKALEKSLTQMTGIAWSYEDPSAAAKVVKEFRRHKEHEKLKIKAGLIDGQVLTADAVESQLATMPGKNELRATLLMTLQAPLQQFLQQLNAPLQNFVYLLKAKEDKANEGAPAAPAS